MKKNIPYIILIICGLAFLICPIVFSEDMLPEVFYGIACILASIAGISRNVMNENTSKAVKWVVYITTFLGIAAVIFGVAFGAGQMALA